MGDPFIFLPNAQIGLKLCLRNVGLILLFHLIKIILFSVQLGLNKTFIQCTCIVLTFMHGTHVKQSCTWTKDYASYSNGYACGLKCHYIMLDESFSRL